MVEQQENHALNHQLLTLKPFLEKEGVTEIMINEPYKLIYYDGAGEHEPSYVEMPDLTPDYLKNLAKLIAVSNGKVINDEKPFLTASLPAGERVQVVFPPAVHGKNISFSIRVPATGRQKSLEELDAEGAFSLCRTAKNELAPFEHELKALDQEGKHLDFLNLAVKSKRNIVIAGATHSGKTYIANSLIEKIPSFERLVTIESEQELKLQQFPNKVHLIYDRADNAKITVTPKECLAASLRMNPSRILMAEILGDESWDYIKAISTGHSGSITTVHAGSAYEAFSQITSYVKDSPKGAYLETDYIRQRLFSTIDIVLFYEDKHLIEVYYEPEKKHELLG